MTEKTIFNQASYDKRVKPYVVGEVSASGNLIKIAIFKGAIAKQMKDEGTNAIVGYIGSRKLGLVLGGMKHYAQILDKDYFDMKTTNDWSPAEKHQYFLLVDKRIALNWALANKKMSMDEYEVEISTLEEQISRLRGGATAVGEYDILIHEMFFKEAVMK